MQKIAQKIYIFLKIAKNRGRDFPEGHEAPNSRHFAGGGDAVHSPHPADRVHVTLSNWKICFVF